MATKYYIVEEGDVQPMPDAVPSTDTETPDETASQLVEMQKKLDAILAAVNGKGEE